MLSEEQLAEMNVYGAFGDLALVGEQEHTKRIEMQTAVVAAICPTVTDSEELKRIVNEDEVSLAFFTLARRQTRLDERQSADGYDSEDDLLLDSKLREIDSARCKVMSAVRKAAGLA